MLQFLSTPSARRATILAVDPIYGFIISIHALREEGDSGSGSCGIAGRLFLSTPSARRATNKLLGGGEAGKISIHALREEGDQWPWEASFSIC